uniref:hypothetical protein n=1 Tax=Synechococcus sp. UW106 TaxID=368495 RepID=UPI001483778F|nr:hypothetical protein [Synechococcus sp. UW106]
MADVLQLHPQPIQVNQMLSHVLLNMDMLLKQPYPPPKKNWVEAPALLAIALLARAFTPLQLHPHRLFKSREFWTGFIEHFEGTRLGIPDVSRRPVEFVKGHSYLIGVAIKLKTLNNATCIK